MPNRLQRYYGARHLHFITTSCYQRRPLLGTRHSRDCFSRCWSRCADAPLRHIAGYVVVPEHVHLLLGEPERGDPSLVMQAVKQGLARRLLRDLLSRADSRQGTLWSAAVEEGHIWQRRFYAFVVFPEKKRIEKLRYMHYNPVKRGLVLEAPQWAWSSFRHYAEGERGPVLVSQ